MSGDETQLPATLAENGLQPHNDAREVIRLFQCSICSYPLREPMTLPCGNALCRPCLPPIYKRENITYPLNQGRAEGFLCPFKGCGLEHSLGDCGVDVTLNKLVEIIKTYISRYRVETSDTPIQLDEKLNMEHIIGSSIDIMPRSRVLHGGRLVSTYVFADMGELNYYSDVDYKLANPQDAATIEALDVAVAENLKEAARTELECQVCYALMLDPLTTSCGHTYCRKCVARVLDHSSLCPICRRRLPLPGMVQGEPSNKRLTYIIQGLLPDLFAARVLAVQQEEEIDEDAAMPLFPCTLAYPQMPTFLHIFEPRYRLMIRRAMENGTKKFGMLMHNSNRQSQGSLGPVHFRQYGTILHVENLQYFPDGRSVIETRGGSRFRVLETTVLDGYLVGKIQRYDDIPLTEEEGAEARETTGYPSPNLEVEPDFERMSTQRLLEYGLEFINRAQLTSARWLHQRVLAAYGQPPTDPALFPYWFASVLPIHDDEKYLLLPTTSVRERLKITARWIQRLEATRVQREAEMNAFRAQILAMRNNDETASVEPTPNDEAVENSNETETSPSTTTSPTQEERTEN